MSSVIELVDNFESGRGTTAGSYKTTKRVLLVDTYEGWEDVVGVPAYGDAHPDDANLIVVSIDVEGAGSVDSSLGNTLNYTHAKLTVNYSTNNLNDWTFSSGDMCAEIMTIQGVFTGSSIPINVNIPIANERLVIPRRSLARPTSTIHGLLGRINSIAWQPDDYLYPVGTVFFSGCPFTRKWDPSANAIVYELQYTFEINPQGWNNRVDPSTGDWAAWTPGFPAASFAGFPPA
jgi:hypothetical protein